MKKYEYKFVQFPKEIGFDFKKKISESEKQWNQLGKEGWMFCKEGNGVIIFVREAEWRIYEIAKISICSGTLVEYSVFGKNYEERSRYNNVLNFALSVIYK